MKIKVYDTHVNTNDKSYYHFDVIVEDTGLTQDVINDYAKEYLLDIGVQDANIEQKTCDFCHNEIADAKIENTIKEFGHFILPMEGCPSNV